MTEQFIWTRQLGESEPAWEAFQTYLRLGTGRSIPKAAAKLDKARQTLETWSLRWTWVARVEAYDSYVMQAETDGLAHELAESRDENLALVRKLRGHLSNRLDRFIERNEDPSIRWTQALAAMAKLEANAFTVRNDPATADALVNVERLIERLEQATGHPGSVA